MVYNKPELHKLGTAESAVLADAPHQGSDRDGNGHPYDYKPVQEEFFE